VELNPDNFDAVYNLGALYFNRAVKLNEVANTIDDMKKFEAARKVADAVFDQAQPILEQAFALNSGDKGVLISLKQLYYRKMSSSPSTKAMRSFWVLEPGGKYKTVSAEMGEDEFYESQYNFVVERLKTAQ